MLQPQGLQHTHVKLFVPIQNGTDTDRLTLAITPLIKQLLRQLQTRPEHSAYGLLQFTTSKVASQRQGGSFKLPLEDHGVVV